MRGTRVGRGLKSGPGEVAASSTRSGHQPAAQLPVALCALAAAAAPGPGRVHARAPSPPRSPLAPPPASTLPTGGAESPARLPAAENRHARRQPASASPVGSGDGPGAGIYWLGSSYGETPPACVCPPGHSLLRKPEPGHPPQPAAHGETTWACLCPRRYLLLRKPVPGHTS